MPAKGIATNAAARLLSKHMGPPVDDITRPLIRRIGLGHRWVDRGDRRPKLCDGEPMLGRHAVVGGDQHPVPSSLGEPMEQVWILQTRVLEGVDRPRFTAALRELGRETLVQALVEYQSPAGRCRDLYAAMVRARLARRQRRASSISSSLRS